jgi:hypothetical protein
VHALEDEGRLFSDAWWLEDRYRYNAVPFQPKTMSPADLQRHCLEARRDFYGWSSILRRSADVVNRSDSFMFRNFFPSTRCSAPTRTSATGIRWETSHGRVRCCACRRRSRSLVEPAGARFACALAAQDDDPAIRQLLRGHALPGDIRLSLEREPDAALATTLGDVHQTLVARDRSTGQIVGVAAIGARRVHQRRANETRVPRALRIDRGCRRVRTVLADGFEFCRTLHEQGDARLYLTSLVADNEVARRLLIRHASGSAPAFVPADRLTTFAIPFRRHGA